MRQATEFLRVKELPGLTGLSGATWDRLVARRAVPVVRIGRAVTDRQGVVAELGHHGRQDALEAEASASTASSSISIATEIPWAGQFPLPFPSGTSKGASHRATASCCRPSGRGSPRAASTCAGRSPRTVEVRREKPSFGCRPRVDLFRTGAWLISVRGGPATTAGKRHTWSKYFRRPGRAPRVRE